MKYKAVLFDLDGVLVNMPEGHFQALNDTLRIFGTEIEKDEHVNFFNGLPTRKKVAELERQGRLPPGLMEFINELKQKRTKQIIPTYCVPDYSKIILIEHLKRKGLKVACCSNSVRETLHLMLKSAELFDSMDLIIGNDEVRNSKPDPEIYLTAMKRLGVKPEESIVVEDAPHGIAAGKASGATVYEVRGVQDVNISLFEKILFDK
jgi:HAD superfamily hydrolase (TIGR01509 family)